METNDVLIRLITDFREDMNARFERVDRRFDELRGELVSEMDARFAQVNRRFEDVDRRFEKLELKLMLEIKKVDDRLGEEVLWGRRELRTRLDKVEREIDELKRRSSG